MKYELTKQQLSTLISALESAIKYEENEERRFSDHGQRIEGCKREYNRAIKLQKEFNDLKQNLLLMIHPELKEYL